MPRFDSKPVVTVMALTAAQPPSSHMRPAWTTSPKPLAVALEYEAVPRLNRGIKLCVDVDDTRNVQVDLLARAFDQLVADGVDKHTRIAHADPRRQVIRGAADGGGSAGVTAKAAASGMFPAVPCWM